ncbi:MAG TPA: SRPBCC domain-containing protein [Thermoleophilaceae bacterium]|nr:SRPBCC domain-containing protein [Thermoleophilaceae bacterium]
MDCLGDYAVVAKDLGVRYDMRLKRRRTLRRTLAQIAAGDGSAMLGRSEFWALEGLTFALRRREVLGVVGMNGSGKSTLLQVIAGVFPPDTGTLTTFGREATLLTLGAGFDHDLTGRENIYLNAAYLGFSHSKTASEIDAIIEFSELGQFIEAPVLTYSSGMRARLGFSIAVHLEPQILLVDEILGVGDAGFQRKSQQKLEELMGRAEAIVLVSHSETFISQMATRVLWLDAGRLRRYGETDEVLEEYRDASHDRLDQHQRGIGRHPGIGEEVGAQEITFSRVFDAPREEVWRAWTEPESLVRWWGKPRWTAPLETITMDVRPLGSFRMTLVNEEDGYGLPQEAVYREVVKPERLVTETSAEGWVTDLTFTDLGDGRTELVLRTNIPTTDDVRPQLEGELASSLDRLGEHLARGIIPSTPDRVTAT